jgi:hypothetical protein
MQPHRDAIRQYLEDFNKNEGKQLNRVFLPLDWQHDSTSGADRAQNLITEQVLEPNKSRIVLMIFLMGSRIGSATGGHKSGTLEEYDWGMNLRAQTNAWPEIKWGFEPIDYGVLNSLVGAERKQRQLEFNAVQDLRDTLEKTDATFLTDIEKRETFRENVLADLRRWIWLDTHPWSPRKTVPVQKDVLWT